VQLVPQDGPGPRPRRLHGLPPGHTDGVGGALGHGGAGAGGGGWAWLGVRCTGAVYRTVMVLLQVSQ
jgi:hypothetical protein